MSVSGGFLKGGKAPLHEVIGPGRWRQARRGCRRSWAWPIVAGVTRRQELATLLPLIVGSSGTKAIHLHDIYAAVERDHPALVDDEVEASTGAVRWKHDLRWELETLVVKGDIRRRKDLGRGMYST